MMMKIKYHNIMTVWQVRFMNMSVVSAVQTQGRPGFSWAQWVSTYRLEYSQDCVNFNSVLNVDGSNQVGTWMFCDLLSHQIIKKPCKSLKCSTVYRCTKHQSLFQF